MTQKEIDDIQAQYDDMQSEVIECAIVIRTVMDMRPLRTYNAVAYLNSYCEHLKDLKKILGDEKLKPEEKHVLKNLSRYFDDVKFQDKVIKYMEDK